MFFFFLYFLSYFSPLLTNKNRITSYLSSACSCFAGYSQSKTHPETDCEGAYIVYLAFIACNLIYDTTSIAIGKRGSAAIGCVGSSLSLVLTVVLTQVPWLTGLGEAAPLNAATGVSVVLVVVGLVLYSVRREMPREKYATEVTGDGGEGKSWLRKMGENGGGGGGGGGGEHDLTGVLLEDGEREETETETETESRTVNGERERERERD